MPGWNSSRVWRKFRLIFRGVRIFVLGCVLSIAGGLLYLNKAGLPGFLKARLLADLESRGVKAQFQNLRLSGYHEVIAEGLSFGEMKSPAAPRFSIERAALVFNRSALHRLQAKVDGLEIQRATIHWPLSSTSSPPVEELVIEDAAATLLFLPEDRWQIIDLRAKAFGARLTCSGVITNCSDLWKRPPSTSTAPSPQRREDSWPEKARRFARDLKETQFAGEPALKLRLTGDAKDLSTFTASAHLTAPGASTPWGAAERVDLLAAVVPGASLQTSDGFVRLQARRAHFKWSDVNAFQLEGKTSYSFEQQMPLLSEWSFKVDEIRWKTGAVERCEGKTRTRSTVLNSFETEIDFQALRLTEGKDSLADPSFFLKFAHSEPTFDRLGDWLNSLAAPEQLLSGAILGPSGEWRARAEEFRRPGFRLGKTEISGGIRKSTNTANIPAGRPWSNWGLLSRFQIDGHAETEAAHFGQFEFRKPKLDLQWSGPVFSIKISETQIGAGSIAAAASADLESELVQAGGEASADWDLFLSLLSTNLQRRLAGVWSAENPRLRVDGRFSLPASFAEWREALGGARGAASLEAREGSALGLDFDRLEVPITFTNRLFSIHGFELKTAGGNLRGDASLNQQTSELKCVLRSDLDPSWLIPALPPDGQFAMKLFQWTDPPEMRIELAGNPSQLASIVLKGQCQASNFIFNGEPWHGFRADFDYSSNFFRFYDVHLSREGREVVVPEGGFDLKQMVGYVTNAVSNMDPVPVVRVMGPEVFEAVEPYHFLDPPLVRVNGRIPTSDISKADLFFEIEGSRFNYWRFNMPDIRAQVIWKGNNLSVSNVTGSFYGGQAQWEGHFHFLPDDSADYGFTGSVTNVSLRPLMADLVPSTNNLSTNQMSGALSGNLVLVSASTKDWKSWKGYGDGRLAQGQLWSVPIFGFLAPALNAISPGLGNNTATSAKASFTIENGVIHTRNMEVHAPALRLRYNGSVDFDGNLNARVEAEPLRDTRVIGKLMSMAFWPLSKALEYKISGTLGEPQTKPLYIPKVMMFPFRPFHTLKELFPSEAPKEENRK